MEIKSWEWNTSVINNVQVERCGLVVQRLINSDLHYTVLLRGRDDKVFEREQQQQHGSQHGLIHRSLSACWLALLHQLHQHFPAVSGNDCLLFGNKKLSYGATTAGWYKPGRRDGGRLIWEQPTQRGLIIEIYTADLTWCMFDPVISLITEPQLQNFIQTGSDFIHNIFAAFFLQMFKN